MTRSSIVSVDRRGWDSTTVWTKERRLTPPRITTGRRSQFREQELSMTISFAHLQPIVSLIAGILILIMPRLLNYIVAAFLIFSGIVGLGFLR
jgi:Protein of unknown function (DUF3096)